MKQSVYCGGVSAETECITEEFQLVSYQTDYMYYGGVLPGEL